jgi:hypothetical protein
LARPDICENSDAEGGLRAFIEAFWKAVAVAWRTLETGYDVMKLTIAFILAWFSTTAAYAEIYNYSCKACLFPRIVGDDGYGRCDVVDGKTFPLRVDDSKNVLEWRGKKYSLTELPSCGRYGWHAEGNGTSFDFCTATKGYGAIATNDEVRVQCDLRR